MCLCISIALSTRFSSLKSGEYGIHIGHSCGSDESITMSIVERTHNCYEHYDLKTYQKLFTCDGCKTREFGERYHCELCGHELHRECRFPHTTISHEFFGCSTLTFRDEPFTRYGKNNRKEYSKCCDACGKDICGFSYHCAADNLDLHPTCRNLDRKLVINETVLISCRQKVRRPSAYGARRERFRMGREMFRGGLICLLARNTISMFIA
ncbi:UNVERIFIED_CONTAM: hypothetical protein Sangu_2895700 [Sesamum angustifolium]|uniref:Phorbol-ester/DAG-type domain-containing protein n=1 Tax=Sesamum angustifolium TaxID=2727405 RepID=A0AAW2ILW6_9LAMI